MKNDGKMGSELLQSWNTCHGAFYQVKDSDLQWNMSEQALVSYSLADVSGVPVLLAEATPEGVQWGILEKGLWVSLFGEIPQGRETDFVRGTEDLARERKKGRIAIGSDEFHFLPGIPSDDPVGVSLISAFDARSFSKAECVDYVGELRGPQCSAYVESSRIEAKKRNWRLVWVKTNEERKELTDFLMREFPGRWSREWKIWQARADVARAFWCLLYDEKSRVLGFSRLAVRGRLPDSGQGWVPGAMRLPLNPAAGWGNTDSCLGPIGISAQERGRGAGKILLGLSLYELCLQGANRTCIDWTNAYNYYTPLGFEIVRRYFTVWKEL